MSNERMYAWMYVLFLIYMIGEVYRAVDLISAVVHMVGGADVCDSS
jgi:hypothetical protein